MAPGRPFRDRAHAGRLLVSEVGDIGPDPVVLGLARGGVPVAAELARAHGAELDVLVVRKVGHPEQPEYALGAVTEDGVVVGEGVSEESAEEQLAAARAQAAELRGRRSRARIAGRSVLVVDDGLATGSSMAAALESVRRAGAARCAMAVPVAAAGGFRELGAICEAHAILVVPPRRFFAVGTFYDDFGQVEDADVRALLASYGHED